MKRINAILCLFALASSVFAQKNDSNDTHPVTSSSIAWYVAWFSDSAKQKSQTCSGYYSDRSYILNCTPENVRLRFDLKNVGSNVQCQVSLIQLDIGVSDLSFNYIRTPAVGPPWSCDGFPAMEGQFTIKVVPANRSNDIDLTKRAHEAALKYLQSWPTRCEAFFPFVSKGDPFFHVYIACDGILDSIIEFSIWNGQPSDLSHWSYSRHPKRRFPEGADLKLRQPELWFTTSWLGSKNGRKGP